MLVIFCNFMFIVSLMHFISCFILFLCTFWPKLSKTFFLFLINIACLLLKENPNELQHSCFIFETKLSSSGFLDLQDRTVLLVVNITTVSP